MNPSTGSFIAVTAFSLMLPGCVTSTQATRLQKDLDEVKRQIFQVQQDTSGSRARLDEMSRAISSREEAPTGQADLQAAIQTLMDQIQALSERMEEIKGRMASLAQEIQAVKEPGRRGSLNGSAVSPVPSPSGNASPAQAEQAFQTAYADYSKGDYDLALMGFSELLKTHPGHVKAPEALYWIGECLYSQGKFKEAAEAFDRALQEYPAGEKAAAALLKKGYAQIEAGRTSQAVATLQKLIQQHPRTDEARLAEERLKQLGLRNR